jgi:integrase
LAVSTGAAAWLSPFRRQSELLGLRWRDIDFDAEKIHAVAS